MTRTDSNLASKKHGEKKIRRRELQKKIEELRAENRRLQANADALAARLQQSSGSREDGSDASSVVSRPRGCAGDGFNLREEMGLQDKPRLYRAIQRCVRGLVGRAGLDWRVSWRSQSKEEVVKLFRVARKRQPYLRRFANDWATEEFAKQYLKNHRAYCRRKRYDVEEDAPADEVQDLADDFELHHIDDLDGNGNSDSDNEPGSRSGSGNSGDDHEQTPVGEGNATAGPSSQPMDTD